MESETYEIYGKKQSFSQNNTKWLRLIGERIKTSLIGKRIKATKQKLNQKKRRFCNAKWHRLHHRCRFDTDLKCVDYCMALGFIIRCPKIAVFYQFFFERASGFFYDSRRAETLAFNQLKVPIFALVNKKKEPVKRTAILGHVKRPNVL